MSYGYTFDSIISTQFLVIRGNLHTRSNRKANEWENGKEVAKMTKLAKWN